MPEKTDQEKLNPRIRDVEIGTRILRTIKIYPLAISDFLKFKDVIIEIITMFVKTVMSVIPEKDRPEEGDFSLRDLAAFAYENLGSFGDEKLLTFIVEQIENKMERFFGLVTENEDPKKLINEIDPVQATEIATIIYEKNFLDSAKNVTSLVKSTKEVFGKTRQLQEFANITDTDSTTSTENDSAKAA